MMKTSALIAVVTSLIVFAAPDISMSQECDSTGDGVFGCCPDGDNVGEQTVFVKIAENAFTDETVITIMKPAGKQNVILMRDGSSHKIGWQFQEGEPPVFIIDDDHRTLPGVVRFGKLEAKQIRWTVAQKTLLTFDISSDEFLAAKNGVAIRVENTWMQPAYQLTPDFSCAAAWKLLE